MLTNAELARLKETIEKGLDRSDPFQLSAADQMMDAMRQNDNMAYAIREAGDRDVNQALQDALQQGVRDAAARDAAGRDAAARDAAARDAAARDAAAARDVARDHAREAAYDRQVADHNERNIAAADRIHEARAMGGRDLTAEALPPNWCLADLRDMPFRALIRARAEALGIRLER